MKRVHMWCATMLVAAVAASIPAQAAERVTFTKDVLPILQENCQNCHRSGGSDYAGMIAPMSFMTFQEARPWARAIAKQVETREMPPWHADEQHAGVFSNERSLTSEEIATIVNWVETGAARGRPGDAPEPVAFADEGTGWSIGQPDLIVSMPEPYFLRDDIEDLYVNFPQKLTDEQLPQDRYMKAAEIKSGSEAVHHVIARPFGGMAPGNDPTIIPEDFGLVIKKGQEFTFNMHYHKESGPGTGLWDNTTIGVTFHPVNAKMKYRIGGAPANIGNSRFEIPPGHPNWLVGGAHVYEKDTMILSFMPHLHLRGKDVMYKAFYPDGTTEVLLSVSNYDFNWQHTYRFAEPKMIPAGTRLEFTAHFDNSVERAEWVGFNPERSIRFGGPTTDEMHIGWLSSSILEAAEPLNESD